MTTPEVKLGGVPLSILPGQTISWSLTIGPRPHVDTFEITAERAELIFGRSAKQLFVQLTSQTRKQVLPTGPLTLSIAAQISGQDRRLTFRNLYAIDLRAGRTPNTLKITVADSRIWWDRRIVERAYNLRKQTGERRWLPGVGVVPHEIQPNVPDFGYRRATLNGTQPWTAEEILEDVLTDLGATPRFDTTLPLQDNVEGLELHHSGSDAVATVLSFLPGIQVYQHPDGSIRVFNTLDGSEAQAASQAGAPIWGSGDWRIVDRSLVRPPASTTYSVREQELRFNFLTPNLRQGVTISPGREPLWLENVLPCPEPTLTLPSGRTVAYGTPITFEEFFGGLELLGDWPGGPNSTVPLGPNDGSGFEPLSEGVVRRFWMMGLSLLLDIYFAADVNNIVWTRRINAVQEHWRQTFRVLPQWRDKIRRLRPLRAAVIDQENATRAPAQSWFDHTVRPSLKGLIRCPNHGWVVEGYADDLSNVAVSPAEVTILNSDLGLIRISPRPDLLGIGATVTPGIASQIPSGIAGDVFVLWNAVELDESWRMATIVSAQADVPNNETRLHAERITAAEALQYLGVPSQGVRHLGHDFEVFSGEESARYAWDDSLADEIQESFFTGTEPPGQLLTNPDTLRAVALAQAARIYAVLMDRAEGQFAVSFAPDVVPTGSIARVTHGVSYDGNDMVTSTSVSMPPVSIPPSIWAFLPENVRRFLRGQVEGP